jgi:lipoate-protein ligase A
MRVIEGCPPDPVANVALDGTLFATLEDGRGDETVRFWESRQPAVVVGRFGRIDDEVDAHACRTDQVPILRRISGGGAVVIGAGCLNYTLVLSLDRRPELREVVASYEVILGWIAGALGVPGLCRAGASDLAIGDRKVGGSAQRRGRRALLHHGTLLYAFDLATMGRYLKPPPRQPAYRAGRPHAAFVTNAPLAPYLVKTALIRRLAAWRHTWDTPGFSSC